jgi:hypothetical protein
MRQPALFFIYFLGTKRKILYMCEENLETKFSGKGCGVRNKTISLPDELCQAKFPLHIRLLLEK